MNNRQKALAKIDDITEKHCTPCEYSGSGNSICNTQCKVGAEIQALGDELSGSRNDKIKKKLDKGKNITTNDVIYLNNNGINRSEIIKSLKIDRTEGSKILNEILNNSKDSNRNLITDSEEMNMHSVNFKKTVKLDAEGMTMQEISKTTSLKISTVSSYLYINNKAERIKKLNKKKAVDEEVGKENKLTRVEKVMSLVNKGYTPKEVADSLDIKVQAVYQDRYRYNQEQKEVKSGGPVEMEVRSDSDAEIEKLENDADLLFTENTSLKKQVETNNLNINELINKEEAKHDKLIAKNKEYNELMAKYDELSDDHNLLVNENKESANGDNKNQKALQEYSDRQLKSNMELRKRNDELIMESQEVIESLEQDLAAERKKHETLFQYVTL